MLIIKKKRIIIISTLLLLSIFAFTLSKKSENNTVPTMSMPVSNKVIVLDAGHGVPDERSSKQ